MNTEYGMQILREKEEKQLRLLVKEIKQLRLCNNR